MELVCSSSPHKTLLNREGKRNNKTEKVANPGCFQQEDNIFLKPETIWIDLAGRGKDV